MPGFLVAKMRQLGMKDTAPIFIRIFKEESQMEIWKQRADGRYGLLKTYSICKWSGALGPKKVEGDRQAPEGFYTVTPAQMNPNSNYYLSFNIGYPNAYDRSLGRTGSNLMVHGACSSAGCYSMTDEDAGEIFALARDAFRGGQRAFEIQAFPFRMTPENLAKHRDNPNMDFWRMLKVGYDSFELTHVPPKVDVCDRHYVFNADAGGASFNPSGACPAYTVPPALAAALAAQAGRGRRQVRPGRRHAGAEAAAAGGGAQQAAAERAANPSFLAADARRQAAAGGEHERAGHAGRAAQGRGLGGADRWPCRAEAGSGAGHGRAGAGGSRPRSEAAVAHGRHRRPQRQDRPRRRTAGRPPAPATARSAPARRRRSSRWASS